METPEYDGLGVGVGDLSRGDTPSDCGGAGDWAYSCDGLSDGLAHLAELAGVAAKEAMRGVDLAAAILAEELNGTNETMCGDCSEDAHGFHVPRHPSAGQRMYIRQGDKVVECIWHDKYWVETGYAKYCSHCDRLLTKPKIRSWLFEIRPYKKADTH